MPTMKLGFESLEARLPFAADAFSVDLELGPAEESLLPSSHTIAGISDVFEVAGTAAEDGRHLFLYGSETSSHFEIFARFTNADGSPGPPPTRLVQIPFSSTITPGESVRFAGDIAANGTVTLVWADGFELQAQQFDAGLQPVGAQLTLVGSNSSPGGPTSDDLEISVRVDQLGRVGVAFTDPILETPSFELYTADLQQRLYDWESTSAIGQDPFDLKLTESDDLGFSLTWLSESTDSSTSWNGHLAHLPIQNPPTESSWLLVGYDSPPEVALASDGGILVAGERFEAGSYQVVVESLDSTYQSIQSYTLPSQYSLAHGNGLIVGSNDLVYLGLFVSDSAGDQFLVQTLNRSVAAIGAPVPMSEFEISTDQEAVLFERAEGGIAAYWHGLALDGNSSAILSRSYKPELVQLDLAISIDETIATLEGTYLEISGLDSSAGIDVGFRSTPNSWIVPAAGIGANQQGSIQLVNAEFEYPLHLQATLKSADPSANESFTAAHNYLFGSQDADLLEPISSTGTIDGGAGLDTLRIPYPLSELDAVPVDGAFRLLHSGDSLLVRSIERYQVNDSLFTPSEFLHAIDQAHLTAGSEASDPSVDGNTAFPVPPPLHSFPGGSSHPANASLGPGGHSGPHSHPRPETNSIQSASRAVHSPQRSSSLIGEGEGTHDRQTTETGQERPTSFRDQGSNRSSLKAEGESPDASGSKGSAETGPKSLESSGQVDFADVLEFSSGDAPLGGPLVANPSIEQGSLQPKIAGRASMMDHAPHIGAVDSHFVQRDSLSQLPVAAPSTTTQALTRAQSRIETSAQPLNAPKNTILNNRVFVATHPAPAFEQEAMFAGFDEVEESIADELNEAEIMVGSAIVLATGISIANIAWTLRSSILLSNLMSSLPIFVAFDPLPLLNRTPNGEGTMRDSEASQPDLSLVEIAQHGVAPSTPTPSDHS
ncbi:MAG: hypothetical protein AAGG44_04625 [Planctomycetota bacterium]